MARIYRIYSNAVVANKTCGRSQESWSQGTDSGFVPLRSFEHPSQSSVHSCRLLVPEIRVQTESVIFAKKAVRLWRRSRRDRQWAARLQLIQRVRVFETPDARHQREALEKLRAIDLSVS